MEEVLLVCHLISKSLVGKCLGGWSIGPSTIRGGDLRHVQDATQSQVNMRNVHGLGKTQNNRARQLGAGGLILAPSENNVVIVEADIEVFHTAARSGMGRM